MYYEGKEMNIKDMVKDKKVHFLHYKQGELWYETADGFSFPVPLSDVGDATFLAEDKAILFMRWIRKHLEYVKNSQEKSIEVITYED